MVEVSDQEYVRYAQWRQQQAKQGGVGCGTVFTVLVMLTVAGAFLVLTANQLGYIPPSLYGSYIGTPQTAYSTPVMAPQRPATQSQQRMTPFYAQPGAAPAVEAAPVFQADLPGATATATPMPTEEGEFYTPEEQTAYAVQDAATATAFYDPQTLATPEPAFVEYVNEQCRDPEVVAQSWMLQQMCKK